MKKTFVKEKILLAIATAAMLSCFAGAADMPLRKVVMYSSGVSYFEHDGIVKDDDVVSLHFTASQMDTLLKSLVIRDYGGGRIGAIEYPAQNPLAKSLEAFPINVSENLSRADLLSQLRGAKVDFFRREFAKDNPEGLVKTTGVVLGIEKRIVESGDALRMEPARVTILCDDGRILALDLNAIHSFTPNDPELLKELSKALATLAAEKNAQRKPFTIRFNGKGERKIVFGYVLDTPIWKCSYRLNLSSGGKARLQGWAIVENQTDSDWNALELSLVSGDPLFLRIPLYSSIYNPASSLARDSGATGDESNSADSSPAVPLQAPPVKPKAARTLAMNRMAADAVPVASMQDAILSGAPSSDLASGSEMGALFEYRFSTPVTLPRRQATMLELLASDVPTEKVLVYDPSVAPSIGNAIVLKNDTDKLLLRGPLTVYDDGAYGGDAEIPLLPPGGDIIARYGVASDVKAEVAPGSNRQNETVTLSSAQGALTVKRVLRNETKYVFRNESNEARSLILYAPIRYGGWNLAADVAKPWKTEDGRHRFRVELPAKKSADFLLAFERVVSEEMRLQENDWAKISRIVARGTLTDEQKAVWAKAVELQRKTVEADRAVQDSEKLLSELSDNQARTRSNLDRLTKAAEGDFHQQLVARLLEESKRIDAEQDKLQKLRDAARAARQELDSYLKTMSL